MSNAEFKVGDKVRVTACNGAPVGVGDMGAIIRVGDEDYAVNMDKGDYWYFTDDHLEPVESKRAFKVGDKVRITEDRAQCANVRKGDIGEVTYVEGIDGYTVMVGEDEWSFSSDYLEFVKKVRYTFEEIREQLATENMHCDRAVLARILVLAGHS